MAENLNPNNKSHKTVKALWIRNLAVGSRAVFFDIEEGVVKQTSGIVQINTIHRGKDFACFETENAIYSVSGQILN